MDRGRESRREWAQARDRLADAVGTLGYPAELADLMGRQLGSPKAMDRMAAYIRQARPQTLEMLMDEMLAICAEIDAWRERKASREAQAGYSARLFARRPGGTVWTDEEEDTSQKAATEKRQG